MKTELFECTKLLEGEIFPPVPSGRPNDHYTGTAVFDAHHTALSPAEYVIDCIRLDELEFDGSQYVMTDLMLDSSNSVEVHYTKAGGDIKQYLFGCMSRAASVGDGFGFACMPASGIALYGSQSPATAAVISGGEHSVRISPAGCLIDGIIVQTFGQESFECAYPMCIGSVNDGGTVESRMFSGSISGIRVYEGDELVSDLVPAMTAGGEYGFYDRLSESFYERASSHGETVCITDIPPISFRTSGARLTDYTIYGRNGGVGDPDIETGKYLIPVTVRSKNIIVNALASQTYNGITLTRNSDGSVTLNGTAEASMNFSMTRDTHTLYSDDYQPIENTVYVISGSPEDAAVNKYMMSLRYVSAIGSASSFARILPEGLTIDNTGGEYNYIAPYISVWSGVTCNNVTFRPMLRPAGTSAEYEAPLKATVNIVLDAPLYEGDSASLSDTLTDIPTVDGSIGLSVGTAVQPGKMSISFTNK